MYTSDEASGALLSIVDGVELAVTPASIAEIFNYSVDTINAEQFLVFTWEFIISALVIEFYEGRQDDDNRTIFVGLTCHVASFLLMWFSKRM